MMTNRIQAQALTTYTKNGHPGVYEAVVCGTLSPGISPSQRRGIEEIRQQFRALKAKYDAAQTSTGNELHWAQADHLDPHSANSLKVRRTLRSRSRYEVLENNPYLKGTVVTICNDFVGKSGPKLKVIDDRVPKAARKSLVAKFRRWSKAIKIRRKLWRMRMAKIVDGETFLFTYHDPKLRSRVKLNFLPVECDKVSSEESMSYVGEQKPNEIDGVKFDKYEVPTHYYLLKQHPGATMLYDYLSRRLGGKWVSASNVIHWFRQDRGWLRGIPETTPSLPLCSILRRYTLAVLRNQETAASFSGVLENEGPPNTSAWTDGEGNQIVDDPFDIFPIEMGMMVNLPWGYKLRQLEPASHAQMYDVFVGSLLREITRPILAPFNVAAGTSKDSNMASAVVDQDIYKSGQEAEQSDCDDEVLEPLFYLWWQEAMLLGSPYLGFEPDPTLMAEPPEVSWYWPKVGIEHTDPQKVANALKTLKDSGFLLDADIQETYFNRSLDDWQESYKEDHEFRSRFAPVASEEDPEEEPEDDDDGEDEEGNLKK